MSGYIEALEARIVELEDALAQFAPFSLADAAPITAEFKIPNPEIIARFKRDTVYSDMSIFHRAWELTAHLREPPVPKKIPDKDV